MRARPLFALEELRRQLRRDAMVARETGKQLKAFSQLRAYAQKLVRSQPQPVRLPQPRKSSTVRWKASGCSSIKK